MEEIYKLTRAERAPQESAVDLLYEKIIIANDIFRWKIFPKNENQFEMDAESFRIPIKLIIKHKICSP